MKLSEPMSFHYAGLFRWAVMAAVLLLLLLALYGGWQYLNDQRSNTAQVTRQRMRLAQNGLQAFKSDTGRLPTAREGLSALHKEPAGLSHWRGPYVEATNLLDPWGRPLIYRKPDTDNDFELLSYGRDGRPGGRAENADITQP